MEKVTKEEFSEKPGGKALSDDELEKVSGGNIPIITYNDEGRASAGYLESWGNDSAITYNPDTSKAGNVNTP